MDSYESSDDIQSTLYGSDFYDPNEDLEVENIIELSFEDGHLPVSRKADIILAPITDIEVVPDTCGTEAPATDGAMAPITDVAVVPATGATDEAVAPITDAAVVQATDDTVAPAMDVTVSPITDVAVVPATGDTVAPAIEKSCVLQLWITYVKSAGDMVEIDTFLHRVQCSFDFQAFWNFYYQTDCGRKMLDAILEKHHYHVSLANVKPLQGMFLLQILDQRFNSQSDVKQFMQNVFDTVDQNAEQELFHGKFTVDPRLHNAVLERVRETKGLDSVWLEFGGKQGHEIYMVCLLEHKMIVTQTISDIVNAAEEYFINHEELVSVDHMWQSVMANFGYLEQANKKFPNLLINWDESKYAFVLKGPRDDVKAAADTVLELLGTAQHEISEVTFTPGCQLEIFTHPEMCAYINKAIPEVAVVWLLNHLTKKIHLFAKDPKQLRGMDKAIKGCVQEKFYPVSKHNSISTQKTSKDLEELKKQHPGRLVIQSSSAGLLVTTADDIHEIVDATIQEIISREGGEDQDAHGPETQNEREGGPSYASFGQGEEMQATAQAGASLSLSKTDIPSAITEQADLPTEEIQRGMLVSIPQYFASEAHEVSVCHATGILCYDPQSSPIPVGQFIAPKPLTKENCKFSITILAPGNIHAICIGLVPQDYPPNRLPGWNAHAIGYHADDGGIFIESGSRTYTRETCDVGDVMEVEINVDTKKGWFRKNGKQMIELNMNLTKFGLYPCVGFHSKGEAVRLNEKEIWTAKNQSEIAKIPPDFPTYKYSNLWISPGKMIHLTKLGLSYSGWLILHNPKSEPVGYRVVVGKNAHVKVGQLKQQEQFLDFIDININKAEKIQEATVEWISLDLGREYKSEDLDKALNQTNGKFKHVLNVGLVDASRGDTEHCVSDGTPDQKVKPKRPISSALSKEDCHICLNKVNSPKTLSCGHTFCAKCIESKFETKPVCPVCGAFHGTKYGDQPDGGEMKISFLQFHLIGFDESKTIQIEYLIPIGRQGPNHPEPGKWFNSIERKAYLPNTKEGRKVRDLLKVAFERKLIFTFKPSKFRSGHELEWSDIEHKTDLYGGPDGYPDPGYLERVQEQLAAKGVTEADISQSTHL